MKCWLLQYEDSMGDEEFHIFDSKEKAVNCMRGEFADTVINVKEYESNMTIEAKDTNQIVLEVDDGDKIFVHHGWKITEKDIL